MKRFFLWSGVTAFFVCNLAIFIQSVAWLTVLFCCATVGCAISFLLFCRKKTDLRLCISVVALAAALFLSVCLLTAIRDRNLRAPYLDQERTCTVTLTEEPKYISDTLYLYVAETEDGLKFSFFHEMQGLRAYDRLRGTFRFTESDPTYRTQNRSNGILLSASVTDSLRVLSPETQALRAHIFAIRRELVSVCDRFLPTKTAPVAYALLVGDTSRIEASDYDAMKYAGLLHILAVSGQHTVMLFGFLYFLTLWIPNRRLRIAICFVGCLLFGALAAFTPSVIRALIMMLFGLLAKELFRPSDSLNVWGLALTFLLILNPYTVASASFLLSFSATLGLILAGDLMHDHICDTLFAKCGIILPDLATTLLRSISYSVAATVFTFPFSWAIFGTFRLSSILSTLLVLPAVPLVFALTLLLVLFAQIPFSEMAAQAHAFLIDLLIRYILAVSHWVSKFSLRIDLLPSWVLWTAIAVGCLCGILLSRRKTDRKSPNFRRAKRFSTAILLCFGILWIACGVRDLIAITDTRPILAALDVGQGACTVVHQNREAIIIDCGGSENPAQACADYCRANGIRTIRALVVSHADLDHINGITELHTKIPIESLILCDRGDSGIEDLLSFASSHQIEVQILQHDTVTALGDLTVTFLTKHMNDRADRNGNSLVVHLASDTYSALIPGDISTDGAEDLIGQYRSLLDVDCFVAPHHGAASSHSEALAALASPEYAIISVGENRYGHPSPDVVEGLEAYGTVLITQEQGTIRIPIEK